MQKDIFNLHYYQIISKKLREHKKALENQVVQRIKQVKKQQTQQQMYQHQEMVHQQLQQLENTQDINMYMVVVRQAQDLTAQDLHLMYLNNMEFH